MDKMPERIWAGYYTAIEGLPSPIWFDEKPENNGDLEGITEMMTATPVRENAEEMRKLVNSQRLIINRLSSLLSYHADVKITDEKDYMSRFVPVEITILKRAKKRSTEVKNLLATIKAEEERG